MNVRLDAMGGGIIIVGFVAIIILFVFIVSAVLLGILLHKKRVANRREAEAAESAEREVSDVR